MKYYLGLNSEENFDFNLFSKFSGVGMIRGENLCINKMAYFPLEEFQNYVTNYLIYVAKKFPNGEVWYRTADLVPHQINILAGCDQEMHEEQYLIGTRGVRRNLLLIDTYVKELTSFIKASKVCPNLNLLIPFVSSIDEVKQVQKILKKLGYEGKLGVMVEIPSIIFMLDEMNELGIDNFTIGVNDLTTNLLGANRDNPVYSNNNIAVYKAILYITKKVHSFGKKVTLAGYLNEDLLKFAQTNGVDIINIHYNEIPLFFKEEDQEFFTSHYNTIKKNYKELKLQRLKNGTIR